MDSNKSYTGVIPNTPFKFLLHVSKPFRGWFLLLFATVTVAAITSQSTSYFFKLIVDAAENGNSTAVVWLGLAYPVTIFLVQLLFRISGWLGKKTIPVTMKHASDVISEYTLNHSHSYFTDRFAGSILTKQSNVVGGIGSVLPELTWTIYTGLLSFLVTFVFMFTISQLMASVFFFLVVFLVAMNRFLAPRKRELSRMHADSRSKLTGRIADVLSNITNVRQYVAVRNEYTELTSLTEDRRLKHANSWMYSERIRFVNSLVMVLAMGLIFYILITDWQSGSITTGDLVLVLALVSQISYSLLFIGQAFNSVAESFGEMEEGLDEIFVDYEIVDKPEASTLKVGGGAIGFKNVSFAYQKKNVFSQLSVDIKSGERIGLVGPSGAGKSTFVSLLLRQQDIQSGAITIDDQNIAEVTQDSLRQSIAMVPQEPLLFHRTIRENILYGKPDASEDEVIEVAKRAKAHDFILALEYGYDTLVGERGVKLSGGQKQRVAIARAMLKESPILMLDEATSALDSESEVAIQSALEELMVGKTVIAVAHRLSTLRSMDRILVFENGQIIEDGSHEELVASCGLYARLWEHQAGGFLQE